jgi:NCAIR mutase (PurE)-related protein
VDDFARLDTERDRRTGIPEAVLADGKTPEEVAGIARRLLNENGHALVTRTDDEDIDALKGITSGEPNFKLERAERAGTVVLRTEGYEPPETGGVVGVITAGTSDAPPAEEAAITASEMGCETERVYDVGVAGVHRLLGEKKSLDDCDALVVAAGREGALPTVTAGIVSPPVIGLPVSVGYGYGGGGEAALAGMLQSCSVLSVVNIDAGFVAGAQAAVIARQY